MFPGTSNDRMEFSDHAVIADNSAANGGGICCHSLTSGAGISLTIGDEVRITGNSASSSGGGIFFSGYRGGGAYFLSSCCFGRRGKNLRRKADKAFLLYRPYFP